MKSSEQVRRAWATIMSMSSFAQLCFNLDSTHSSRYPRPLHVFPVFPKVDVEQIPKLAKQAGVGAIIKKNGENIYSLQMISAYKRRRAFGNLVDFGNYWIILIRTIESPTVAGNIAKRWLKRMYPVITRSYLKPNDLLNILDKLSQIEKSVLKMRGYILRAHDKPETLKKWPRGLPYSRTIVEKTILNENKRLEAMNFLFRINDVFFRTRIETNGHFVFYEGGEQCFSNFYRLVLSKYIELSLSHKNYFSNRERRVVDGEVEISQLTLKSKEKITKESMQSLTAYLSSNYSVAILHSGNPWLFLTVIDRGDGSSFDIYGYPNELQIVPFNKASAESYVKLFHSIGELFPLIEIKEP